MKKKQKQKQKIQKQNQKQKQKQSVNVKIEIGKSVRQNKKQNRKREPKAEQEQQQPIQIQAPPVYYQMTSSSSNPVRDSELASALRNLQEEINRQRTIQPLGSQRLLPPEIPQPTLADMATDVPYFWSEEPEPEPDPVVIEAIAVDSGEYENPRKFRPPEEVIRNISSLKQSNKPDIANAAEKLGYGSYEELISLTKADLIRMLENDVLEMKVVPVKRRSEKSGEFTRPKTIT